jgi:uncharacterized protein YuzE
MVMKLTIDQEADAAYIHVTERGVERTQELDENRLIDLDSEGQVRGIELLNVSHGVALAGLPFSVELAALLKDHGIRESA